MSKQNSLGVLIHDNSARKADYLYRISLKALIRNEKGEILAVKETDRSSWDLPGGGMDHGEDIKLALARELKEEVNLSGDFSYTVIDVDPPAYLEHIDSWQVRLVFFVEPNEMKFSIGEDGDEIAFINPENFKTSQILVERKLYEYTTIASKFKVSS